MWGGQRHKERSRVWSPRQHRENKKRIEAKVEQAIKCKIELAGLLDEIRRVQGGVAVD